jgi:rubrerythrin
MDWYPGKMIKGRLSGQTKPLIRSALSDRIAADVVDEQQAIDEYGELSWTLRNIYGLPEDATIIERIRLDEIGHRAKLLAMKNKIEELERTGKIRTGA